VRRTLLRSAEQRPILLQVEVDLDQLRAGEELHEHAAAPISQLQPPRRPHEVMMGEMPSSMSVPRFDARITRSQCSGSELSELTICKSVRPEAQKRCTHAEERDLRADQEDEQRDGRPCQLGVEWHFAIRRAGRP